jgi:hypothetical protein
MEANAYHVQVQLFSLREKTGHRAERSAKFYPESTEAFGVVGEDTDHAPRTGVHACNFVEFVAVVEGHHVDSTLGCTTDERGGLAGVRKNEVRGIDSPYVEYL